MQLATERTRLHLDGVHAPITAEVTRRRDDGMVVTQALPFLRLDSMVTESGRRSRIARVAIAMEGDVPKLLLELHHDGDEAQEVPHADDTVETFTPGVSARPARTDATVPYEFQSRAGNAQIVLRDPPPIRLPAAPEPPWLVRVWRRFVTALAAFTGPASS